MAHNAPQNLWNVYCRPNETLLLRARHCGLAWSEDRIVCSAVFCTLYSTWIDTGWVWNIYHMRQQRRQHRTSCEVSGRASASIINWFQSYSSNADIRDDRTQYFLLYVQFRCCLFYIGPLFYARNTRFTRTYPLTHMVFIVDLKLPCPFRVNSHPFKFLHKPWSYSVYIYMFTFSQTLRPTSIHNINFIHQRSERTSKGPWSGVWVTNQTCKFRSWKEAER